MGRTLLIGAAAILAGMLAGCSTVESRIANNWQVFATFSPADQSLIRRGAIRQGMSKDAVYIAWGKPDRIRYGSRAGISYEAWIYTTLRTEVAPYPYPYPAPYGFGYYPYGRIGWYGGYYGFYPYDPFLFDTVTYEVPYKIAFFERGRCTGWEISS
jgi:hypothetical protein